jgi:hypothetical protein
LGLQCLTVRVKAEWHFAMAALLHAGRLVWTWCQAVPVSRW